MSASSTLPDSFVDEIDAAIDKAHSSAAPNAPTRLRNAIAACEAIERDLLRRSREAVERHGVRPDVPISTMPAEAQDELNPLTNAVYRARVRLKQLNEGLARVVPDEHGCFTFEDGRKGRVGPDGQLISSISWVSSWQEPDENGELVTYTSDGPSKQTLEEHRAAVLAFKKSRVYRREVRRLRPVAAKRTRQSRPRARRERRHIARTTSSADPGPDPDAEPPAEPWRWASDAAWRSFVADVVNRTTEKEIALERLAGVVSR
jgi:hypothetical protein